MFKNRELFDNNFIFKLSLSSDEFSPTNKNFRSWTLGDYKNWTNNHTNDIGISSPTFLIRRSQILELRNWNVCFLDIFVQKSRIWYKLGHFWRFFEKNCIDLSFKKLILEKQNNFRWIELYKEVQNVLEITDFYEKNK